ncbi:MAG TPA: hypothetical protein VHN99_09270, partial [Deinococcales bacterium]|nr:hypothetical protein [Deinococcales bacterium]
THMKRTLLAASALALATALVACPGTSYKPMTQADSQSAATALTTLNASFNTAGGSLTTLQDDLNVPAGAMPFAAASTTVLATVKNMALHPSQAALIARRLSAALPQALRAQAIVASSPLPTGNFDCTSGTCPSTGTTNSSDNLVFTWLTRAGKTATLTYDWDSGNPSTPPVVVWSDGTNSSYLPVNARADLKVNGTTYAHFAFTATWHKNAATQFIVAPDRAHLDGYINDLTGARAFTLDKIELGVPDTGYFTNGKFSLAGDSGNIGADWDVKVNGIVNRDANGFPNGDFTASSLNFNVGAFDPQSTFRLKFDADQFVSSPTSLRLQNGLYAYNSFAVNFDGTLDDSNQNCVPGENVTLHFGDTPMSLEDYLIANGMASTGTCTAP